MDYVIFCHDWPLMWSVLCDQGRVPSVSVSWAGEERPGVGGFSADHLTPAPRQELGQRAESRLNTDNTKLDNVVQVESEKSLLRQIDRGWICKCEVCPLTTC